MTKGLGSALRARQEQQKQDAEPAAEAPPARSGYDQFLSGRVPDHIFREFSGRKQNLKDTRGLRRKVTNEQGLEALIVLLREPAFREAWEREVLAVRAREQ